MSDLFTPIVISVVAAAGAIGSGVFAARQSRRATQTTTERNAEVEVYKVKVDTETKRLDQVAVQQQKIIDTLMEQNKSQAASMVVQDAKIEAIRVKMEACFDERQDLKLKVSDLEHSQRLNKAEYDALAIQLRGVREFNQPNGSAIHIGDKVKLEKEDK